MVINGPFSSSQSVRNYQRPLEAVQLARPPCGTSTGFRKIHAKRCFCVEYCDHQSPNSICRWSSGGFLKWE